LGDSDRRRDIEADEACPPAACEQGHHRAAYLTIGRSRRAHWKLPAPTTEDLPPSTAGAIADVALMAHRRRGNVKAAGGVRDLEGLKAMVAAGATRVGASAGVKIVQQSRGQTVVEAAKTGY
jgi:hypothetical protein